MSDDARKSTLVCEGCRVRYAIRDPKPGQTYRCRKCGGGLITQETVVSPHTSADLRSTRHDPLPDDPEEVRAAAANAKSRIGKYVAVKELGRGGMGIVYKAWDTGLKRWVALKLLTAPPEGDELARFRREAQMAASIRHPNIVGVYEVGEVDGRPHIAMEFVDGRTLAGQKIPAKRAAELLAEVASAVDHAHSKGIIHRDLKPQNVMIDKEGKPYVMDFGLAKSVRTESRITVSGTVIGTPSYMSPEQARGRNSALDRRTDVYSLGAVLYELLTGRPPFHGSSPLETLELVTKSDARLPSELNPAVPHDLETIALKCLEKEQERRYPTARLLAEDLRRWIRGEAIAARRASLATTLARRVSRNRAGAFAIAVVLVAAVAVAEIFVSSRSASDRARAQTLADADAAFARGDWNRAEVLYQKGGEPRKADLARRKRAARDEEARTTREREDRERREKEEKAQRDAEAAKKARSDAQPDYDSGRRNLDEAERDLYRAGADLSRTRRLLETAVADFTRAIGKFADFHEAFLARGQAQARLRKPREAEEDFAKAVGLLPNYSAAFLERGRLHLARYMELAETGPDAGAEPPSFAAIREKAVADFRRAQELGNLGEEMTLVEAAIAFAQNRPDDAIAHLTRLIDSGSRKEEYFKLRGDAFRRKFQPPSDRRTEWGQKARDDYAEAVRICPNYYAALRYRGAIYFESGMPVEAEADFREGLRINPEDSFANSDMGTLLFQQGKAAEAEPYFDRAVALDPLNYRAWANRGTLKFQRMDYAPARADLDRALAVHPKYVTARYMLALVVRKWEGGERALPILDDLLRDSPRFASGFEARGVIHFEARRWKEALADFRKAVGLDSRRSDRLDRLILQCERELGGG
ncbi:MAG: protein kinase [Planctomycetes bacterium]|nr:protein kinase [Planctomycetota bacterium]